MYAELTVKANESCMHLMSFDGSLEVFIPRMQISLQITGLQEVCKPNSSNARLLNCTRRGFLSLYENQGASLKDMYMGAFIPTGHGEFSQKHNFNKKSNCKIVLQKDMHFEYATSKGTGCSKKFIDFICVSCQSTSL